MTINYCDFLNGDDTTGDGTNTNPYKTIDKASYYLVGGDEVRCAKGADDTDLEGTFDFLDSSTTLATSSDLTSVLVPGDFIYKDGEEDNILEVQSVGPTSLVLFGNYHGITETSTAKQLGIVDTGTAYQTIWASGISPSSLLKFSGGWDLGTQIQDGKTYFRQTSLSYATRAGYGLNINGKHYLLFEKLGFLRYQIGIKVFNSKELNLDTIVASYCGTGFDFNKVFPKGNFNKIKCNYNILNGITIRESLGFIFDDVECCDCGFGIKLTYTYYSDLNNVKVKYSTGADGAIEIWYSYFINFNNLENSNNNHAFEIFENGDCEVNNLSCVNNVNDVLISDYDRNGVDKPVLKIQHFNTAGDNRCYYTCGITYRDTAEARSNQCLRYQPTSTDFYILQEFKFASQISEPRIITFFIKDDIDFDGDVQAALYFMGIKITGWQTIPTTTDYVQHSLIAQVSDITEDGVIYLKIKVRGTTGNVYVDDLGAS